MRCLIDTNIILDVLADRKPFKSVSSSVWKLCETRQIEGCISTLSFADIVYILRKELNPEKIEDILNMLRLIFTFIELTELDLANAAQKEWNDYEDAIQSATAQRIKADCIITRNIKDYTSSSVTAYTPEELLIHLN